MNIPLSSTHKPKIALTSGGTCPHGLPLGACPICSGAGGGGGSSKKAARPAGEMSWDECFAVGQMMKAQRLAQQKKDLSMQAQLHAPVNIIGRLENAAQKIAGLSEKLTNIVQKLQSQNIPKILTLPLIIAAKIAIPILNMLKNVPLLAQKALNFVQTKLADISDKLNAVFGELKASIDKKISSQFENFRKKSKSFFNIFNPSETEQIEEEKKIEEAKQTFELKTILNSIKEKFTQNNKKEQKE